jgi:5-methylcytosine-specific restriction endonuclease McrA
MEQLSLVPSCDKHGCLKFWYTNGRTGKSQWKCRECNKETSRAWREANPEQTARAKRRWAQENAEHKKELDRIYYRANAERLKASALRWNQSNPAVGYAKCLRRRAIKRQAVVPGNPVTRAVLASRFALTEGCCYCGLEAKKTADHFVPLNAGGLHVPSNIVGACLSCNSSKNDRPAWAWYRAQSFFSEARWLRLLEITGSSEDAMGAAAA